MRSSLKFDVQANLNKDAAEVIIDLMEKHNALVAEFNALLAKMDADLADVTNASVDYVSTSASTSSISID